MSDTDVEPAVQCPICGDEFDPAVAGGWCTNPDCGEWQFTDDCSESDEEGEVADDSESEDESAGIDDSNSTADGENAVDSTPSDTGESKTETAETTPSKTESDTDTATAEANQVEGEARTDSASTEADPVEEDSETDESPEVASEVSAQSDVISCPECGTELDAAANFCISCGADVRSTEEPDVLSECPSCESNLEGDENFCGNCGEDLDAHRSDDLTDGESAPVETLTPQSAESADSDRVPESLVLRIRGREIEVEDGDRVGREIRAALSDAGRPEDEAVRIHREHVRFVRESDSFYVVDLGDNPTKLDGRTLQKGDREPISPGDELELSGVATIEILAP